MSIRTNKAIEADYSAWNNLKLFFACNELNTEDLVDLKSGVTITAADDAKTVDHAVDCAYSQAAPAAGSVGFNISVEKAYVFSAAGRVAGLSAFSQFSLGEGAATSILKLTPTATTARLGALPVVTAPSLSGNAVNADEDWMMVFVLDLPNNEIKLYQDVNLGGFSLVDSDTLTESMKASITLDNLIALNSTGFEQPMYGALLIEFSSLPEISLTELDYLFEKLRAGKSYLPESWKNA